MFNNFWKRLWAAIERFHAWFEAGGWLLIAVVAIVLADKGKSNLESVMDVGALFILCVALKWDSKERFDEDVLDNNISPVDP